MDRDTPDESLPSPRLPQELIDLIIGCIPSQDMRTLQACALTSTYFRPRAQEVIFSDIALRGDNLAIMHKCFSESTFGACVRNLAINAMEIAFRSDVSQLLGVLALLACPGRPGVLLGDLQPSMRSSCISSLHITTLSLPRLLDHLHILFAFPKLRSLTLVRVRWDSTDPPSESAFLRTTDPPPLDSISIRLCILAPLLEALFPQDVEVLLRSITLDHYDLISPVWPQLVQRSGPHLEDLEMWPFYGEFPTLDLRPNVHLRALTLHGATIYNDANSWLVELLEGITSPELERIIFEDVRILWTPATQRLMRAIDELLSKGQRFQQLVIVDFYPAADDGRGVRSFNRLAALWMPGLLRRGVLYLHGGPFVSADEATS